ncbi:MAG: cation:proton antiporter [Leucobacter sp.]
MSILIIGAMVAVLVWALLSERLHRWHLSGPVAMVLCGVVVGFFLSGQIAGELNTDLAERSVELILSIILFVDATEIRGGFLAGEKSLVARLLGIALPLSLIAAVLVGVPLLGTHSFTVVLIVALVVMPIDFAPAVGMLRDERLPRRLRHGLAIESGYADALRSPIFAVAILAAQQPEIDHSWLDILQHALPEVGFALIVGIGVGVAAGFLARAALAKAWTTRHAVGIGMVLIPLIAYAGATSLHGNGFLAAFLAGIAYKRVRVRREATGDAVLRGEVALLDGIGTVASLFMWFVFGAASALVFLTPARWSILIFALLALTLLRFIPVQIAFLGSHTPARDRLALGVLGPRGTSTIMFGLLAFNALPDEQANIVLYAMVVTVLSSIVLHGFFGPQLVGRFTSDRRPAPQRSTG